MKSDKPHNLVSKFTQYLKQYENVYFFNAVKCIFCLSELFQTDLSELRIEITILRLYAVMAAKL